jgi:outer membrane protein
MALGLATTPAVAQQTPPVAPKLQETPLPPPIELPLPPGPTLLALNRPLSAEDAAQIALRNQPDLVAVRSGIAAAQGRTQQARAGLLPSVGVGAGYTRTESLSSPGGGGGGGVGGAVGGTFVSASGYQGSVNLRQLLFDFGRARDLTRQARAGERAASANFQRAQEETVLAVKQAFYAYVQNVRLAEVNESNVRNQQAHLALAQARLQSGLGLPSDVVRAQTAVAEAILGLTLARNNAAVSRVTLAQWMGIDPRTPLRTAEASEPAPNIADIHGMVAEALKRRPEVLEAQANLQAAEHGLRVARQTNAPSVAANLGVTARGSDFPPRNSFLSIGASIQWNPFDAGLTAGRMKEAKAVVEAAHAQIRSVQIAVTAEVSEAYLNLRTAEQRLTTAEAAVVNAEESVRLTEGRYRAGIGTFLEVTDAQAALLTARTSRVNAQTEIALARAALSRAAGLSLPAQESRER